MLFHRRPSQQAVVVEPDHVHRLIGSVGEFHQGSARVKRDRVTNARHAPHGVQHVVRHANGVCNRLDRGVHDPDRRANMMTVAEALLRTPAKSDVMATMRKTANVIPTRSAVNLALSLTSSLHASFRIPFISSVGAQAGFHGEIQCLQLFPRAMGAISRSVAARIGPPRIVEVKSVRMSADAAGCEPAPRCRVARAFVPAAPGLIPALA